MLTGPLTCYTIESGLELWLSCGLSAFGFPSVVIETMDSKKLKFSQQGWGGGGLWGLESRGQLEETLSAGEPGLSRGLAGETLRTGCDM